jgi:hypothetical protein
MTTDFGRDITCTDSLKTGSYSTGVRLVAEAIYRRLITRRGELMGGEEEREYGLRVADYLGADVVAGDLARLEGLIRQEILKDQRVGSVDVSVTEVEGAGVEREWTIDISAYTALGPFDLVLSVSAVTTEIVGLTT